MTSCVTANIITFPFSLSIYLLSIFMYFIFIISISISVLMCLLLFVVFFFVFLKDFNIPYFCTAIIIIYLLLFILSINNIFLFVLSPTLLIIKPRFRL